ncbi:hypothetical protein BUALT_Bualt11G0094600 [Buddleja alternifolia]|uniref:Pentatricopeptide repeat-containing protein n=1 Tax=Buddleja alternifolia TaxID=168488 RepID=A0AAV6WV48_9LAMI|nr:hypothetical protein BUALT_Bualt11G0094600 [Buddleja alternifolia]
MSQQASISQFSQTLDPKAYISSFFKCRNLSQVHQVHGQEIVTGLIQELSIANKILYEYTLHRALECGYALFRRITEKNQVSWSSMIGGYAKSGDYISCNSTFREYMRSGIRPDNFTLPLVMKYCFVAAVLVDMYAKCKAIDYAKQMFDEMPERDLISWTVMIGASTECGNPQDSLDLFDRMREEGVMPDKIAMVNVANASAKLGAMHEATIVDAYIRTMKFSLDVILGTAVIDMHAKCGNIEFAREIFDKMREKNVISWSTMIAAHGYHGEG